VANRSFFYLALEVHNHSKRKAFAIYSIDAIKAIGTLCGGKRLADQKWFALMAFYSDHLPLFEWSSVHFHQQNNKPGHDILSTSLLYGSKVKRIGFVQNTKYVSLLAINNQLNDHRFTIIKDFVSCERADPR
jgi:hypothetical protein